MKVHSGPGTIRITTSGVNFTAEAQLLTGLITYANNIAPFQLVDSPALQPFADTFFDVSAKAEDTHIPSADEFRLMVQRLLTERFHLRTHREVRDLPVYALMIDERNGPRFAESSAAPDAKPSFIAAGRNYEILLPRASMADLVRQIENSILDRPVLDETGLSSRYTIQLTYAMNTRANRQNPDPDDVDIFAAVAKLGLRLIPSRRSFPVLMVDSVQRPVAD